MVKRIIAGTISLLLFCGVLTACGRPTPTSLTGDVETRVAATIQAGNGAQAAELSILPTVESAQVLPRGSFAPYAADSCELVRIDFKGALGVPMAIESVAFSDRVTGGSGTACRIQATGDGNVFTMDAFTILDTYLRDHGWIWDKEYSAGGPTGMMEGYRKGGALGLLSVTWRPSADDLCPSNQPIGACELLPGQRITTVIFDIGQVAVYVPLPAEDCSAWMSILLPSLPVPLVLEMVNFTDLKGDFGTACQVHGAGTGIDFNNFMDTANTLDGILVSHGWTAGNRADGPTGTAHEYTKGSQTAVVTVMWHPSIDANCPKDQPIGNCVLNAEQRIYTLSVAFAMK